MSKKPDKSTIEKLVGKHAFNRLQKAFNLEYKFEDAVLEDGTAVKIEPSIEEGATVVVVDSEGSELDAPDGEHQLADGTVIVTEAGVIIQVIESPEVPEKVEQSADGISPELTGILSDVANRLKDLESKFKAQTEILSKVEAIEKKVDGFNAEKFATVEDLKATKTELDTAKELIVKMANQSETEPLRKPKKTRVQKSPNEAAIEAFSSVIKKSK